MSWEQYAGILNVSIAIVSCGALAACDRTGNDEHAYVARHGSGYVVEMKARRRLMAHDPVSAVRGGTYEETLRLELPRIEGIVEAREIPVRPGSVPYAGRVVITRGRMSVDLYYDDGTANRKVPLPWNGEYTLIEKSTAGRGGGMR